MSSLIGICGLAGSGKSTAARRLASKFDFESLRFAGPLKAMMTQLLTAIGVDESTSYRMIEGDLKEQPSDYLCGRSPRQAMQWLGTEWGRDLMHPDFWINICRHRVLKAKESGRGVVVEDVRFPNEALLIRSLGGILVKVDRPMPTPATHNPGHSSESIAFEPDLIILNDSSLDNYYAEIDDLVK